MTAKWNTKSLFNSLCPLCNAFLFNYIKLHFLLVSQSHFFFSKENYECGLLVCVVSVLVANLAVLELNMLFLYMSPMRGLQTTFGVRIHDLTEPGEEVQPCKPPVFVLKQDVWPLCRESKTVLFKAELIGMLFLFLLFFCICFLRKSSIR